MTSLLVRTVSRSLLGPAFMVAFAVLVKGYVDTGDGFAAGVIASLAVLLQYVAFGSDVVERTLPVRFAPGVAAAGLAIGLGVTFVPTLLGRPLLTHWPPAEAKPIHLGTLEIITAMAFDVGVFLLVLGFAVTTIRLLASAGDARRERPR